MPLPLFLGIGAAVAAAVGVGAGIKAGIDEKDAKDTNRRASDIIETATAAVEKSKTYANKAITKLGKRKITILDGHVVSFIELFEQLHNIEFEESEGLNEIKKFKEDPNFIAELRDIGLVASSLAAGVVSGAAAGAVAAFGAYGIATTVGVCATTGTAISTLSGAALTNATLAFLGGGALSAGGLGVAGGTAILGGLVAGPFLAVTGLVVGAKARAHRDKAYSNLSDAYAFKEEANNVRVACNAVRMRANMFESLLIKLDSYFEPALYELRRIINVSGTDYSKYTMDERKTVAACLSIVSAIKAVIDTPILSEDGSLTKESEQTVDEMQKTIESYEE